VEKRTAELSAVNEQLIDEIAKRKKLEKTLVQRIGWLTQFNKIHQAITGTIDLAQADEQASQLILKLLDAQYVVITRWGTQKEDIAIRGFSQTGETAPFSEGLMRLFQTGTPLRQEIELGNFIQYSPDQLASLPGLLRQWFLEQGVQSLVFCPMVIRQSVVGVMVVASSSSEQGLTRQTEDVIGRMAYDLAKLAEDAELFDQKRALVTMDERNRLARELHDSVAQGLYSISLFVDAIRMALDSNRLDTVKQHLDELVDLSREAMADMRVLIFELRPPVLEKEGLVTALQTRLDSVEAGFKPFPIRRQDPSHQRKEGELSGSQEALSNVIKHAMPGRCSSGCRG
jgi:signal transduction histidine kinase